MKIFSLLLPLALSLPAAAGQKIVTFADGLDAAARAGVIESRGGRIVKEFPFINGVLADFPDERRAADLARARGVESAEDDLELYWLASEEALTLEAAQAALRAGEPPAVQPPLAQPPAVSTTAAEAPFFYSTANSEGKIDRLPWSVVKLGAVKVWDRAKGAGARVAVLDTGVDCSHPDLAPNCLSGYNVLAPGAAPMDDKGHGTHVSGIIAGALNWSGMAGLAPEAKVIPVKVLNSSGTGKVSQIIEGIEWAVRQRPDVINMSLGSSKFFEAQAKAVKAARKAGVLVVCAAGNDGGPVNYPAAYEDAVAVSAMDFTNAITGFSCRGPEVDFIAPGHKIFSAAPGGKFMVAAGTSQAAPQVSGLAALAVSMGAKGEPALLSALRGAAFDLGLPPEHQGAGVPTATGLARLLLSGN
ncbi:MAG: S8 family serine peptidase [Elusimicrobiales bacterium]|nr:S8 family serine peptidase [Elusimicrobiales bacterium]